ncbi:MAG TPA: DNA polymerase/3'-5' exonuclease PolX [Bacillota bacterium]|nr:DNA polymerase/3'-5' exonuclease PolX [Bacillota bacterium]
MNRHQLVAVFNEIGLLLELAGENPFKSRAYYQAARTLETLKDDPEIIWQEGRINELPGFGETLVKKVDELMRTGELAYLQRLREETPEGLFELMRVPGLGPKKVRALYEKLSIQSLEELKAACLEDRLSALAGFGQKTQDKILEGIHALNRYQGKYLPVQVAEEVGALLMEVRKLEGVLRVEVGGSFRRRKEVIKDLDFVIAVEKSDIDSVLMNLPMIKEVISAGPTKVTLRLRSGILADFRLVPPTSFASAWLHFTGSAEHNTELRRVAKDHGWKLNEYGLFSDEHPLELSTEADLYKALGLSFIPPELREGSGEVETASKAELPQLIQGKDLLGVLHCHTLASDGRASLEEMANACKEMGFQYLGIGDHSRSARYARGLEIDRLLGEMQRIDQLNGEYSDFKILKGVECDILPDGSLDYPDEILEQLDYVVASVHSNFQMEQEAMTQRIIKAMQHPRVNIIGHPTGRILLNREGYAVDMERVIEAAVLTGTALEFNAHPYRYDLDWRWCRRAVAQGVKLAINPDAHSIEEIPLVYSGVEVIRKGWVEPKDVINTWDCNSLQQWFDGKSQRMRN